MSCIMFREANQLSEEMGKDTEFAVTLQVQCSMLFLLFRSLRSFHWNGHMLGFHPQTQKLEPPRTAYH